MEIEKSRAGSVMDRNRIGWGLNTKMSWQSGLNVNELFRSAEKKRKGSGRVVGADGDRTSSEKYRRRATRRRFQAWLDRGKRLEDQELDGTSQRFGEDKVKRMYIKIRLGPTAMKTKIEIFSQNIFLSLK
jgi:hypothetical protein